MRAKSVGILGVGMWLGYEQSSGANGVLSTKGLSGSFAAAAPAGRAWRNGNVRGRNGAQLGHSPSSMHSGGAVGAHVGRQIEISYGSTQKSSYSSFWRQKGFGRPRPGARNLAGLVTRELAPAGLVNPGRWSCVRETIGIAHQDHWIGPSLPAIGDVMSHFSPRVVQFTFR